MEINSLFSFPALFLFLGVQHVQAALNGRCCVNGLPGVCVHTKDCFAKGGGYVSNFCPYDPPDVVCCIRGACGSLESQCSWTDQCLTQRWVSNLCPGPDNFKCCMDVDPSGHVC